MNDIPQEHFKPYVPNGATKLGRAYLCAVKDCDGPLLATEASFLRDNPLLWLRALTLYASNLDFLIRQAKTRLKNTAPGHGEHPTKERTQELREHRRWSMVQEHKLHKIRARRAELAAEFGYEDIRQATATGDLVEALAEILSDLQQENWREAEAKARHWIRKLTGLGNDEDEPSGEPEAVVPEMTEAEVLATLMAHIKGGGRS
jgi:hypothetical protein